MIDGLYFIFGNDDFRRQAKLEEVIARLDAGRKNVVTIDCEDNFEEERLINELLSTGLFAQEKTLVVKNLLTTKGLDSEVVIKKIQKKSPTVNVIILEKNNVDKRTKLYKFLFKSSYFIELQTLSRVSWEKFALELVAKNNIDIEGEAQRLLLAGTEGNGWQLQNILEQLRLYCLGRTVTSRDIDLFLPRKVVGDSFALLDALKAGNDKVMVGHLAALRAQSEPVLVLGAIAYQYRALVYVKGLLEAKTPYAEIARRAKIMPFVVGKLTPLAKNLSWSWLAKTYQFIAQTDINIKTGAIAPEAGIELLVYNLSRRHKGSMLHIGG
ncbi:MAG TPA: DNA polymerase III subunit delta [bacterium]|jgi:DNA polymerase-3 subunit delta|nr:DNA polymerase III subunit delta [bacterium]